MTTLTSKPVESTSIAPAPPEPTEVVRREFRFRNGAAWWDALGRVPLERIVFDPPPGTATIEDVVRLDDHEDTLCELAFGTLVRKAVGVHESFIAVRIGHLLSQYLEGRGLGFIAGEGGTMRILSRQVRIPDVSFICRERLPAGTMPDGPVPDLTPDLAVEVISESNTPREMANKLREYFEAGTRLVWHVDPKTRTVEVYTSPQEVNRLTADQTLNGGEVLPGFEVKVADLFPAG